MKKSSSTLIALAAIALCCCPATSQADPDRPSFRRGVRTPPNPSNAGKQQKQQATQPTAKSQQIPGDEWSNQTREVMRLYRLHRYHQALPVAARSLTDAERDHGPKHLNTARSLNNMGLLNATIGKLADAEPLYLRAFDIMEALDPPPHHELAIVLDNLSRCYVGLRRFGKGEELARRTIQARTKAWGSPYPDWSKVPDVTANTLLLGEVEAMPFDRVLRTQIKSFGPDTEGAANQIHNRAMQLTRIPMPSYAELLYQRALEIRTKLHGTPHPLVADTTFRLGALYEQQGRFEDAKRNYQTSIDMLVKAKGPSDSMVAVYRNSLAGLHRKQGNQPAANRESLEAGKIMDKRLNRPTRANAQDLHRRHPPRPANAPDAELETLLNQARMGMDKGNYAIAESPLMQALVRQESLLGQKHPDVAGTLEMLGVMCTGLERYQQAENYLARALGIHQSTFGRQHPFSIATLILMAETASIQGKTKEKKALTNRLLEAGVHLPSFTRARARYQKGPARASSSPWNAKIAANWYRNWGNYQQHLERRDYNAAVGVARLQSAIAANTCGSNHLNVALARERLAHGLQLSGAAVQAEPEIMQALKIRDQRQGFEHPAAARTRIQLAYLYLQEKKHKAAIPYLENAITVLKKLGNRHVEDLLRAYGGLEQAYRALNRPAEADRIIKRMAELGAG